MSAASAMLSDASGLFRSRWSPVRRYSDSQSQIAGWNEIVGLIGDIGGHQLEFVSWRPDDERILGRLCWQAPQSAGVSADWEFHYSMRSADGAERILVAKGVNATTAGEAAWTTLQAVSASFCNGWSDEVGLAVEAGPSETDVLMFPRPQADGEPTVALRRVA